MKLIKDENNNVYCYATGRHVAVLVRASTYGFVYLDNQDAPLKYESETSAEAVSSARKPIRIRSLEWVRSMVKDQRFVDSFLENLEPEPEPKEVVRIKDRLVNVPVYRELETFYVDPGTAARLDERFPPETRDPNKPIRYYIERLEGEEPCDNDSFMGCLWRALKSKRFWPRNKSRPMTATDAKPKSSLHDPVIVRLLIEAKCESRFAEDIQKEMDAFAPYCYEHGMFTGLTDAELIEYDWDSKIAPVDYKERGYE